jgi:hypothetical protein
MVRALFLSALFLAPPPGRAAETGPWQAALSRMPLGEGVVELNRTNCVDLMLRAFQSNGVVKALVFMPGATDEFYLFRRAKASLGTPAPSLLDAVSALTNQTLVRATFRAPFLLLHTDEDPLEPEIAIEDTRTAERLKHVSFVPHALYNDRDWDYLQPLLRQKLDVFPRPARYSRGSWHFYRHSFAAWYLTGWEALEAAALAGKTRFTVGKKEVTFQVDRRTRSAPNLNFDLR